MKRSNDCGGYILVTVAALLFVMLGVTALAIDIGLSYGARAQNQAAADAGALAGAATYLDATFTQAKIENNAAKAAIANKTLGLAIGSGDVTAAADMANRRVTVTIDRDEPTFFSRVIGFNSVHVRTQ